MATDKEYTAKEKFEVIFREVTGKEAKTLKPSEMAEILTKHRHLAKLFREAVIEASDNVATGMSALFPKGTGR